MFGLGNVRSWQSRGEIGGGIFFVWGTMGMDLDMDMDMDVEVGGMGWGSG